MSDATFPCPGCGTEMSGTYYCSECGGDIRHLDGERDE